MIKFAKSHSFSLAVTLLLLGSVAFWLQGCADQKWLNPLTGEPGDDVLMAPRVVGEPPATTTSAWPRLGDVPEKPNDITPAAGWHYLSRQMVIDKREGEEAKAEFENNTTSE